MSKKVSDKHINWLDFGMFEGSCLFVCGFSYEETLMTIKKKKFNDFWIDIVETSKPEFENDCSAFARRLETETVGFLLVLKKPFDFSDAAHRLLAHECLHLASFNLRVHLDPMEENETLCYMHTYLMKQVHTILRS